MSFMQSGKKQQLKIVDFLKKVSIFSTLDDSERENLVKDFHLRKYKKGEIIFHQGDDSQFLYIVQKGKVRVYSTSPSGNETTIRIFANRNVVGEFAALDGMPRSTTAQAVENCDLLYMTRPDLLRHIKQKPKLGHQMINLLLEKLRWTTNFAETIAQYDTAGRLLHTFLRYKEVMGTEIEAGKCYEIDMHMSQSDLASMVGARREWVNRILQKWKDKGLIQFIRGKVKILDLKRVEKERDRSMEIYSDT